MIKDYKIEKQVKIRGKLINIPLIYKCEVVNLVFTVDAKKVKDVINCSKLKPLEIYPSRSLLFVTLFNFNETPVGPYTEITYSIPVNYNKITIPFLSFIYQVFFNKLNFYVYLISQSTDIAIEHGNVINGYPHYDKIISSNYKHKDNNLAIYVQCQNKEILSLNLVKPKKTKYKEESFLTYKYEQNTISSLLMETFGKTNKAKLKNITFGNHDLINIVKGIDISKKPIDVRYYSDTTKVIHQQKIIDKL